jgi:hypothetical protein
MIAAVVSAGRDVCGAIGTSAAVASAVTAGVGEAVAAAGLPCKATSVALAVFMAV